MRFQILVFSMAVWTVGTFGRSARIVGGENAEIEEFPFMASLRYKLSNVIFCCGVIISDRHVLTAAHCFYSEPDDYNHIRIYTGVSISKSLIGGIHRISRVVAHPGFTGDKLKDGVNVHDIAIAKVNTDITLNQYQNVIGLPTRDIENNDSGYVLGWGSTAHPEKVFPDQLQKAFMRIEKASSCIKVYPFKIHSHQLCVFNKRGIGPCIGDSGGPLVVDGKVAAIVSFNYPCAKGVPDIYIKVYPYLAFIREVLALP